MKTIKKLVYAFLCAGAALSLQSCGMVRFVPQGGPQNYRSPMPMQPFGHQGGQLQGQQQQGGQRSFKPYYAGQKPDGKMVIGSKQVQTGTKQTKTFIGGFGVELWNSEDMGLKQQARVVIEKYFRENKRTFPTDNYVSEQIGYKCRIINKR